MLLTGIVKRIELRRISSRYDAQMPAGRRTFLLFLPLGVIFDPSHHADSFTHDLLTGAAQMSQA